MVQPLFIHLPSKQGTCLFQMHTSAAAIANQHAMRKKSRPGHVGRQQCDELLGEQRGRTGEKRGRTGEQRGRTDRQRGRTDRQRGRTDGQREWTDRQRERTDRQRGRTDRQFFSTPAKAVNVDFNACQMWMSRGSRGDTAE